MPDQQPQPGQTSLDMDDTEHLPGGIPAGPDEARAARWEFYRDFRARQGYSVVVCVPDQMIHCFGHYLDRTCVCGRYRGVSA